MTPVPSGSALVRFDDVGLGYGGTTVIEKLSFAVARGDFLGIVGPNGAGKSTILKAMLGILRPARGGVVYEAEVHRDLRFGYVPQRHTLDHIYPLTVRAIVRMARYARAGLVRRPGADDDLAVTHALEAIDIVDLAERRFAELSGGQRQRALIARALATGANFLVLDEPTDGMDLPSQEAILTLAARLHREEGLTVILVSHLLNEVAAFADRLAMLESGRFLHGPTSEVLTAGRLSDLYGVPVAVERVGRATVVLPESRT